MPKSWINQSLDSAEGRDSSAADGAQYLEDGEEVTIAEPMTANRE